MSASKTHTITLPGHDFADGELDNDDRAAMVRPLLDAFWQTYYGDRWENEPAGMVLSDMIADLYHLADHISTEDDIDEMVGADEVHANAWRHYDAEVNGEG